MSKVYFAAPVTFVLLIILGTKFVQRLIAIATDHDSSIWSSYMIVGGLLVIGGSMMMRKRFDTGDA